MNTDPAPALAAVVPLRDPEKFAPLNDIPGCLRRLADQIERGEHGDLYALFVVAPTNHKPMRFEFGDALTAYAAAGLFTHCANLALRERE